MDTGFIDEMCNTFNNNILIGQTIELKTMSTLLSDRARHPVFLRFREDLTRNILIHYSKDLMPTRYITKD